MRSCIYCGRELENGEVCSCPQSVARRARQAADSSSGSSEKNKTENTTRQSYSNPYRTETSYRTGYAGKDSKFERAKTKYKARRAAKKSAARNASSKGFFKGLWRYVIDFIKAPVEKISNPGYLGKGAILTIAAVQGAVLWLCMYFVLRGGAVGPFRLLASVLSFNGAEGYRLVGMILLVILSGAVGGVIMFLLYAGIFYLINRFIMRLKTPFWEFSIRLAATWIPFTVICAIGAVLSLLSPITLMVLILCGAVTVAVLTYEALRTEWISQPASKVLYAMILGYFVFFTIIGHLILL